MSQMNDTAIFNDAISFLFNRSQSSINPFTLTFITCDKIRKKGGDIIILTNCIVPISEHQNIKVRESNLTAGKQKNPNHLTHRTINIFQQDAQRFYTVHIDLITELNNKRLI